MSALFGGAAPRVRATRASTSLVDAFTDAMIAELYRPDDPFALSDALILAPNRRAQMGLLDAFAEKLGGAALLPTIRPLGDVDDDPDVWGAESLSLDLPRAIDPLRRRLELASLIRKRDEVEGGVADPVRALAFADELCRLLDSAAAGEPIDWSKLDDLVQEREFAAHWARSAQFLQIVTRAWPLRLAEDGLIDASARRNLLLETLARTWSEAPPQTPIVIAGSTGSIRSTRVLMAAVARLPRGAVLLPGLDADLDDAAWDKIGEQHPQHALRETLRHLGIARRDVEFIGAPAHPGAAARRVLIGEALVPADATADWRARLEAAGGADLAQRGSEGLTLIEAETDEEEASVAALLLRETLETPGATAALVTPDANLARRVEAKLARWGVQPMMTQSRLLAPAPVGVMLAVLAELARDAAEPVAFKGLMTHPFALFDMDAHVRRRAMILLTHACLRGPRTFATLEELRNLVRDLDEQRHGALDKAHALALIGAVEHALAPLTDVCGHAGASLSDFADAMGEAAERTASGGGISGARRAWSGPDGGAASLFLKGLIEHGGALGPLSPLENVRAFQHLLSEQQLYPARGGEPRAAILGPLEARLVKRDLVILGSLNEGAWPAIPREDPFLSRTMRAAIGLPSPDARMGLAAHDFAQLANAPRVVMTRALKSEGSPTLASRWVWRLKTLLRAAQSEDLIESAPGADARLLARIIDAPVRSERTPPPKPRLKDGARIARLSVTDVETLIRDPYAIWAKRVLRLPSLDPIGMIPGANVRGSAIHKAIDRLGDDTDPARLAALIDEELARVGYPPERRAADHARGARACRVFTAWLKARQALGARVFRERPGELMLAQDIPLTARADRIDVKPNGRALVADYKTGAVPSGPQVKSGLNPQLLLEAAMLARGAFEDVGAARADELIYWHFGGREPQAHPVDVDEDVADAAEKALARLETLLATYRSGAPMLAKPRVQIQARYTDYDLLSRYKEWADAGDAE